MQPTLWHIPISHYSEKVRWALDHKKIPHRRRAVLGGRHPLVAMILTRGEHQTAPVLTVDGRGIGDSTAIIAELEARYPDRPLYPADPAERARALELEEWLDEELGPAIRRLAYHEILADDDARAEVTRKLNPWVPDAVMQGAGRAVAFFVDQRFGVRDPGAARRAEERVLDALDRLERELDGRPYLVGDTLSVADITAASLFYPLVLPPEGPWIPAAEPAAFAERRTALAGRPGVRWVAGTYARHRGA